ncbi:hypothetical protein [Photobacterium angustum]|uniref:hypothetical protein n=1 Tax=Photobacterium angustum TaxID=661 RepID=UPI0005E1BE1B|nr:hypothetical protein [Photobacterium angustum]KJG15387.1 hypothetical protein UA33_19780 [Photobacterium angustum]KJG20517.1 hypothetical protein UA39_19590 [Photobacterium angustum]KJG28996.1 hypothetical protein UA36_15925 [Photobacterium angustum]PSW95446.1 hypothetical protein C0W79_11325 [Photobacterium angustum]PSX00123.1 hypothetical protein C0W87_19720 [Photobacterium angustum]
MMNAFFISLFFSSALHAAPSLHHLDYSIDFHNKYGTDGLLISSPNIQFIYKEIDRHCYKLSEIVVLEFIGRWLTMKSVHKK